MRDYTNIFDKLPDELKGPLSEFAEAVEERFHSELHVSRHDFTHLDNSVRELAESQKETDLMIKELRASQKETDLMIKELRASQKETDSMIKELRASQKQTDAAVKELSAEVKALSAEVKALVAAQKETDAMVKALSVEVKELRASQKETDAMVKELAAAQKRTDAAVNELTADVKELAAAQKRTDAAVNELTANVKELAAAQKSTENTLNHYMRSTHMQLSGIGARWGMQTEASFRNALEGILTDVGFHVEKYRELDTEGMVFPHPNEVDLDVVIRNGQLILIEIKSSMSTSDVYTFERRIKFYETKEGRLIDRKFVISPFVDPNAMEAAERLGMEVFTDVNEVS